MIDSSSAAVESTLNTVSQPPPPLQNVAFAVNYSEPLLEQFDSPGWRPQLNSSSFVANTDDRQTLNRENQAPHNLNSSSTSDRSLLLNKTKQNNNDPTSSMVVPSQRSSKRERKRKEIARDKNRVRYDMNLVPGARRNREFLNMHVSSAQNPSPKSCLKCQTNPSELSVQNPMPFSDNASIVWIPQKRSEWEDCISELTAVCTSAAIRRRTDRHKPFYAPLSSQYIKDRVDIDDPLNGYQVRHKGGGWLQGFIMWTNFTTWTHYFKWDSLHPVSGVNSTLRQDNDRIIDSDGVISKELESQPRSGDPMGGGVVFSTIAEIGLLGGLGCGEYMLKMALDDIISKKQYKFVVLQATDLSRKFYERYGFVRVGAVSRYGSKDVAGEIELVDSTGTDPDKKSTHEMASTVGYRHWTYATETTHSLDLHGGPSYMMALRLPDEGDSVCDKCNSKHLFWDKMMKIVTTEKPNIMQLGAASTPAPKKKFRNTNTSPKPKPTPIKSGKIETPAKKRMARRRSNSESLPAEKRRKIEKDSSVSKLPKVEGVLPTSKKASTSTNLSSSLLPEQRKVLLTPPPPGKSLTYAQKQYQSVWLAVPPSNGSSNPRKPPRRRNTCPEGYLVSPKTKSATTTHSKMSSKIKAKAKITEASKETILGRVATSKKRTTPKNDTVTVTSKNVTIISQADRIAPRTKVRAKAAGTLKSTAKNAAGIATANPTSIRKQKIAHSPKSTPSRTYYYNKVVKAKRHKSGSAYKYHFVLNYNEEAEKIRIVPLIRKGVLTGKRQGRPRFKAAVSHTPLTASALDYKVIPAYMVTKTAIVANETWDILE
eukprot:CAMPEP_0195280628 /NCGR_PEP_ID=MMETSP0707-20130614/239_1 /TAXON_ID=33640 /ORGANISM="Asterionellopsis glacialis, Strain CCMP134" /LENGTH=822 /DNA_ID=CAMNT_0040339403 /DNA_START=314 /DNA_END=2782 /DNA_ORIENTATION=-